MIVGRWYLHTAAIWHWHLPLCIYKTQLFDCLLFLSVPFFIYFFGWYWQIRWNGWQYQHAQALCTLLTRVIIWDEWLRGEQSVASWHDVWQWNILKNVHEEGHIGSWNQRKLGHRYMIKNKGWEVQKGWTVFGANQHVHPCFQPPPPPPPPTPLKKHTQISHTYNEPYIFCLTRSGTCLVAALTGSLLV